MAEQQIIKCPRCDSLDTKFCYFNNNSLSQPRHLCKTCSRKWTVGGALRDIPIGGAVGSRPRRARNAINASSSFNSAVAPPPPQSLPQEVVANQSVSPPPNRISQIFNQVLNGDTTNVVDSSDLALLSEWLCSQPIGYTYHQGSGGGIGAFYLSNIAGEQSLNASQAPFNQSLNGGGVNFGAAANSVSSPTLVQPQSLVQNQLVSPTLPITTTYPPSSVGGGAQAGHFTSPAEFQPLNGGSVDFMVSNQATNYSSPSTLAPLVQNQLVGSSLPITSTYDHGSAGGGAQAGYFSSLLGALALDGGVDGVGSSDLVLQSGFNAVGASQNPGIESFYDQGFIQPGEADNNVVAAVSHYQDPQSFINTNNDVAGSDVISWDDMFGTTSNINGGNSDENFTMPNHGSGLPCYGAPPPPQN